MEPGLDIQPRAAEQRWDGPRHLRAWLDFVLALVERHVARHGHRMLQNDGRLSNLHVSFEEARRHFGQGQPAVTEAASAFSGFATLAEAEARVKAAGAELARVGERSEWSSLGLLPIELVRRSFGLDHRQLRLLMAAAAPLLSTDIARLYTFAWADFTAKQPPVGFLAELVADSPEELLDLSWELAADAPLCRHRLLVTSNTTTWNDPTPLLHRGVAVPDRVLAWLEGRQRDQLPLDFGRACTLESDLQRLGQSQPIAPAQAVAAVDAALADDRERPARLLLVGPRSSGRRTLLGARAAGRGRPLLVMDLEKLRGVARLDELLADVFREAMLQQAVMLLRADALVLDAELLARLQPPLERLLVSHPGPLAVSVMRSESWLHRALPDLIEVELPLPPRAEQRALWCETLAELDVTAAGELADILVERFDLPPGAIRTTAGEAVRRAQGKLPQLDDVAEIVRRRSDHTLSQIAEPFRTTLTWDDVVLPDEVLAKLEEVLAHARHREFVFDSWGFRRKMSYGRGLSCLFAGPSGTGKTMVASVLAQTLGRELYRVDLSRVTSKWVGETEKNLARVFDEAEKAQVILLFDEADSLFSSRTEVKSSNDRYANMEVNFLLQRMEAYDGMTILTTNFEHSIDEAFKRRIKFRIHFPLPDAAQRAMLWRSMIPPEAETAPDINFAELGARFKLAGGAIKNAVLRAAFAAIEADRPIGYEGLRRAAVVEMEEMGKLISG